MALSNKLIKAASLAAMTAGALLLSEPAFAFHGGGFHGGGFHGGGFHGGGFHGGGFRGGGFGGWRGGGFRGGVWRGGGWRGGGWGGGWGGPYWGGAIIAPAWGWGWGPGWGWDDDYYAAPVYSAPIYVHCYIRRVRVHTRYGLRWRRVRYCYQ